MPPNLQRIWTVLVLLLALAATTAAAGQALSTAPQSHAAVTPPAPRPLSPLEAVYGGRAGEALRQFGYALFDEPMPALPPTGAVQDDYILGVGDQLTVTLRGQSDADYELRVDREGRILPPRLRPLVAAGRTLGDVRAALEAEVAASLVQTDVYVSVSAVRQIGVLVVGEVARPGRRELTAFATVLEALAAAGGVGRQGSLRAIRLVRGGETRPVDLYDLLREGRAGAELRLHDGDRVVVPPVGPTLAVAGLVKQPGIYELPPDRPLLPLGAALALAGGPLLPGPMQLLRLGIGADGTERADQLDPAAAAEIELGDGDVLLVNPVTRARAGAITLAGHVAVPGPRALAAADTLAALLADPQILLPDPTPNLPFAAIETTDPRSRARVLVPIDLQAVLAGRQDRPLADGDTLIVLAAADVPFLTAAPVLALLRGEPAKPADQLACVGLVALDRALSGDPEGPLAAGPLAEAAVRLAPSDAPCPDVFKRYPALLPLALQHAVLLWRGVPRPGFYPAASDAGLAELLALAGRPGRRGEAAAGQTAHDAAQGAAQGAAVLHRPGARRAAPGDVVAVTEPGVRLEGAVRLPGFRPLAAARGLRALLGDGAELRPEVYPLLGAILRQDRASLTRQWIAFSPRVVLTGEDNPPLQDGDTVRLFTTGEIAALLPAEPGAETEAQTDGVEEAEPPRADGLPDMKLDLGPMPAPGAAPQPAVRRAADHRRGRAAEDRRAPEDAAGLRALLGDRLITLRGAVVRPGAYPAAGETALAWLIAAAGGTTREADLAAVEIIAIDPAAAGGAFAASRTEVDLTRHDPAQVFVRPGDAVRINPLSRALDRQSVAARGEVRRPGAYDLVRGERLSDLIARAGGLTELAYPAGAIFSRASARTQERLRFRQMADELDRQLAAALAREQRPTDAEIALVRDLAAQLRAVEPVGRLVVEADPARLTLSPELDIVLEPGDRLILPRRPLTVAVSGEVQAPAALQYRAGKAATAYIRARPAASPRWPTTAGPSCCCPTAAPSRWR